MRAIGLRKVEEMRASMAKEHTELLSKAYQEFDESNDRTGCVNMMRLVNLQMQIQRLLMQVATMARKHGEHGPELRVFWEHEFHSAAREFNMTFAQAQGVMKAWERQEAALAEELAEAPLEWKEPLDLQQLDLQQQA